MSLYGYEMDMAFEAWDQAKKMRQEKGHERALRDAIINAFYHAVGGSPFSQEAERALQRLLDTVAIQIEGDPVLRETFERDMK